MELPVPFENEPNGEVRSPQTGLSAVGSVPETLDSYMADPNIPIDSDTVSNATVTQEVSHVAKAEEGGIDGTGAGVESTGGRVEGVPESSPATDGIGAPETGNAVVDAGEQTVTPQSKFLGGQLVSTPWGIMSAAEVAERSVKTPQTGQTHGKVQAAHGVHLAVPAAIGYGCADCQDLLRRVVKAFKELGYEFPR